MGLTLCVPGIDFAYVDALPHPLARSLVPSFFFKTQPAVLSVDLQQESKQTNVPLLPAQLDVVVVVLRPSFDIPSVVLIVGRSVEASPALAANKPSHEPNHLVGGYWSMCRSIRS